MSYLKHILSFNNQLSFQNLKKENLFKLKAAKPDGIVITGMGGSGLAGTILTGLSHRIGLKTPIVLWKNYGLPETNFKKPLFVFISWSGDTEETVSGFRKLLSLKERPPMAAIATNGSLAKLAEKNKIPLVHFNATGLTPREGLGYTYYSLLKILREISPQIRTPDLSKRIKPSKFETQAKNLAKLFQNKTLVIYTDANHSHLGYVWKAILNETAKQPAFTNTVPEMCHNEIAAFEKQRFPFSVLFLNDGKTSNTIKNKTKLTQRILKNALVQTISINLSGRDENEKNWNSIILAHLTSFYLAKLKGANPIQTNLIDQLKKMKK